MGERTGVLFVCMGNICRSPVARCIFEHLVSERGVADRYLIDSCGTGGWHEGQGADPRSVAIAAKYGLDLRHMARQVRPASDFDAFPYLLIMDQHNRRDLLRFRAPVERVHMLRAFDPSLAGAPEPMLEVPDPYYGGDSGFEAMYQMLDAACRGLLEHCERARG
jgi:protein-tyrosine phosphatase